LGALYRAVLNYYVLILSTNAMIVSSYEGGGRHSHLGLTTTNEEYFATDVFTAPENPRATPMHANNATAAQITEASRAHKGDTHVYRTYCTIDQVFKKLIVDEFWDQFLNVLSDEVLGYVNRT
jgi:hypothetical protein